MQKYIVAMLFIFHINYCISSNNMQRFALSLFDDQGEKTCDIMGRQATMTDNNNFEICDIFIASSTDGNNSKLPRFAVVSDFADVNTQKNEASGSGFIAISNPTFSATGNDWKFKSNVKSFIIKNVQVFL